MNFIFQDLYLFLQWWTNADRILFNVVDDRTVGDVIIICSFAFPQEQKESKDKHQGYKGSPADESKDCGDMILYYFLSSFINWQKYLPVNHWCQKWLKLCHHFHNLGQDYSKQYSQQKWTFHEILICRKLIRMRLCSVTIYSSI